MKLVYVIVLMFMLTVVYAQVQVGLDGGPAEIGINLIPEEAEQNFSVISVNSSLYWDTADRGPLSNVAEILHNWLNSNSLLWSNAGHTIDTDLDMNQNNIVDARNISAINATFQNVNITQDLFVSNSTIYIGNSSISSSVVGGKKIVTFDDSFVDAVGYFGDGGFLDNITFVNGTVIALAFNGSEFFGGNFYGTYDWIAEHPLIFNGTYLYLNQTYLNDTILDFIDNINTTDLSFSSITLNGSTITDWSQVNYTVSNGTVVFVTPSVSGSYSVILPEVFNFEIAQIIVVPSVTTGNYRFGMYELGGETIDADLITHTNTWNIFKSYPIDNQVSLNFSSVSPAKTFQITIKFFTNVAN